MGNNSHNYHQSTYYIQELIFTRFQKGHLKIKGGGSRDPCDPPWIRPCRLYTYLFI